MHKNLVVVSPKTTNIHEEFDKSPSKLPYSPAQNLPSYRGNNKTLQTQINYTDSPRGRYIFKQTSPLGSLKSPSNILNTRSAISLLPKLPMIRDSALPHTKISSTHGKATYYGLSKEIDKKILKSWLIQMEKYADPLSIRKRYGLDLNKRTPSNKAAIASPREEKISDLMSERLLFVSPNPLIKNPTLSSEQNRYKAHSEFTSGQNLWRNRYSESICNNISFPNKKNSVAVLEFSKVFD